MTAMTIHQNQPSTPGERPMQTTETTSPQTAPPAERPWMRRKGVVTAVAGGVLAVTAFLSGAAVGHAWDGSSTGDSTPFGPGGGRFGTNQNGPFQGGPPGSQNGQNGQNGQVPQGGVPTQGQTAQTTRVTVQTSQPPRFDPSLYELWLTPARVPEPVAARRSA
jgi:hypothetical protein